MPLDRYRARRQFRVGVVAEQRAARNGAPERGALGCYLVVRPSAVEVRECAVVDGRDRASPCSEETGSSAPCPLYRAAIKADCLSNWPEISVICAPGSYSHILGLQAAARTGSPAVLPRSAARGSESRSGLRACGKAWAAVTRGEARHGRGVASVERAPAAQFARYGSGSTGCEPLRSSKRSCGWATGPVLPALPITCPRRTSSPAFTSIWSAWA